MITFLLHMLITFDNNDYTLVQTYDTRYQCEIALDILHAMIDERGGTVKEASCAQNIGDVL